MNTKQTVAVSRLKERCKDSAELKRIDGFAGRFDGLSGESPMFRSNAAYMAAYERSKAQRTAYINQPTDD